jgi:hypothetical protein
LTVLRLYLLAPSFDSPVQMDCKPGEAKNAVADAEFVPKPMVVSPIPSRICGMIRARLAEGENIVAINVHAEEKSAFCRSASRAD